MLIINLILIYTIIQLGFSLFNKSTNSAAYLGCGLVGFSGKEDFNEYKIKLLMLYNESRGEDSTGYYTDSMINPKKGATKATFFLQEKISPNKLFIGHTRAKTVGVASERNAHPFKFGDIIMAHNGSLKEYVTLANKYDIAHNDYNVDSEIICAALNKYKDPRVLYDLEGAASVLFTNDAENGLSEDEDRSVLYCYRKNFERPLYRGTSPEGIYLSSLDDSLRAIGCTDVTALDTNTLYKIVNGVIVSEVKLPDTKIERKAITVSSTTTTSNTNSDEFEEHNEYYMGTSSIYSHAFNISSGKIYKSSMIRKDNSAIKIFDDRRQLATVSKIHFKLLPVAVNRICTLTEDIKGTADGKEYFVAKGTFVFVDKYTDGIFEVTILPTGEPYEVIKEILRGLTPVEQVAGNNALDEYNVNVAKEQASESNSNSKSENRHNACCNLESPFKGNSTQLSFTDKIMNNIFREIEDEDKDNDDALVSMITVQNFILEVSDTVDDIKDRIKPEPNKNYKYIKAEDLSSLQGVLDDLSNGLIVFYDKISE